MKVLVTGGAGYIGSVLVPMLLALGHRVRVFDSLLHGGRSLMGVWSHPGFEFLRGDVCQGTSVESALRDIEAVVHLAAIVGDPACARQPDVAHAVNLEATLALIEASRRQDVSRFVFASTCSNYGRMSEAEHYYVDETSELRPVSLYAETKVAVEKAIMEHRGAGFCPTILRFATVFGVSPRMRLDLTVNHFVAEMITKKRLLVFGEHFWRPYVHVRDAANAVALVLNAAPAKVKGEVFNVGSTKENYRKLDLIELVRPYAPDVVVEYVQRKNDQRDYRVSFDKVEKALEFGIQHTVPDGIREVARLVRDGVVGDLDDKSLRN